jgi:hypothetical protein
MRVWPMVSMAHEVLVDLFRNRPSLAAELLAEALNVALPPYTEARLVSIDLTQVQPTEYRADAVVTLLEADTPVRVIIVEVQLAIAARKRFTWPAYVTLARAMHGCPADLLVIAPDEAVAAWCAEPISIGVPGFELRPPVLGRVDVPIVTDAGEAARRPELGVLSAMAHGMSEHGATIASAVLPAIGALDDERTRFYYDLVYISLGEAARQALEAKMKGYEYQSDFAKKYVAIGLEQGRAQGLGQGLEQGREQGRAQGREQGREQGRAEGERALLLRLLRARFGDLPPAALARVEGADIALLEQWGERVLTARTLAEVLDEPPR